MLVFRIVLSVLHFHVNAALSTSLYHASPFVRCPPRDTSTSSQNIASLFHDALDIDLLRQLPNYTDGTDAGQKLLNQKDHGH